MLNITIDGISDAMKMVEELKKVELDSKVKLLLEKLMDLGFKSAEVNFSVAMYPGNNDVVVRQPYWDGDRLILEATGNAVAFIEFGAGVHYESIQYPIPKPPGVVPLGTWGKKKGAQDSWIYVGEPGNEMADSEAIHAKDDGTVVIRTHGNPPSRTMYFAGERIKDNVLNVAKEIFR